MYLNHFIPNDSSINKGFEETESFIKILDKVVKIISFKFFQINKLTTKILTFPLKLVLGITIGILIVPVAYLFLVISLRKSTKILKYARTKIPTMRVSDLEKIQKGLNEKDKGLEKKVLKEINDFPIILKPLIFALKETLNQYTELKDSIDRQIEEDLLLFSEGLKTEFPIEAGFLEEVELPEPEKQQDLLTCSTR